jgi:transcription elongation factor GreA
MRVPIRKPGRFTHSKPDPHITQEKFDQLTAQLNKLLTIIRPQAIEDMQKHASNGDFSENAPYQIAKGRLRGLNQKILEIEELLKIAEIIQPQKNNYQVAIGNTVTVEINNQTKTLQILGSSETDPSAGIISGHSPIGAALLGHSVGETVKFELTGRTITCKIINIS